MANLTRSTEDSTPSALSILLHTPMIRPRNRMYSIPPQSCPQTISPAPSLFPRPRLLPPSVPSFQGPGSHSTIPLPRLAPSPQSECSFLPWPGNQRFIHDGGEWKKSEDSCLADIWRGEVTPLLVFDEDRDEYFPAWEDYSLSEDGDRETRYRYGWSWEGEERSRAWTDGGFVRGRWMGAVRLTV